MHCSELALQKRAKLSEARILRHGVNEGSRPLLQGQPAAWQVPMLPLVLHGFGPVWGQVSPEGSCPKYNIGQEVKSMGKQADEQCYRLWSKPRWLSHAELLDGDNAGAPG